MKTYKGGILSAVAALALAAPVRGDDAYTLFVSGWPAENPRQEAASAGSDLETGAYTASASERPLEARFRTWSESGGRNLNTTAPVGFHFILR